MMNVLLGGDGHRTKSKCVGWVGFQVGDVTKAVVAAVRLRQGRFLVPGYDSPAPPEAV